MTENIAMQKYRLLHNIILCSSFCYAFFSTYFGPCQMVMCKRFRGSHCAENIHEMFEDTIAPYHLTQRIPAIVTDNAANMVKEFSLPGMEILDEADSDDDDPEGNDIIQPIVMILRE